MRDGYIVIDTETTVKAKELNNRAHFAHPDNFVVCCCAEIPEKQAVAMGYKPKCGPQKIWQYANSKETSLKTITFDDKELLPTLIVGHNVKFDLLYLLRQSPKWRKEFYKHKIWDTQHVEYLLSGQVEKFISLDRLSAQQGLPLKDSAIKDMWDGGMETEDIPAEKLVEYCQQDVSNTHAIFLDQVKRVTNLGIEKLVLSQMQALQALVEMEYNGMVYSGTKLYEYTDELTKTTQLLEDELHIVGSEVGIPDFNPASRVDLNLLFFGGEKEVVDKVIDGEYKTGKRKGQPKWKNVARKVRVDGVISKYYPAPSVHDFKRGKDGLRNIDEDVLAELSKRYPGITSVVTTILKLRAVNKEYKTYAIGYSKYGWPYIGNLNIIHPNFNTTSTSTGRLSSSNPNMQNTSNVDMDKV